MKITHLFFYPNLYFNYIRSNTMIIFEEKQIMVKTLFIIWSFINQHVFTESILPAG